MSIEIESSRRRRRARSTWARPRCPEQLPVLPLRDTVTFPDTLTPLAVGQERSIQLVNDVLARRPHARDGRQPRPRARVARPGRPLRRRRRRHGRADAQGARRHAADPRPGRPARARSSGFDDDEPYLVARVEEAARRRRGGPGADGADAQRPADVLEHHRGGPVPARGAADGGRQRRRPVRALAPDRRRAAASRPRRSRRCSRSSTSPRRLRRLSEILARELEVVAIGSRIQSQVQSEIDRSPARVRPAPAAQGDPGGARRARPRRGRGRRAARAARARSTLPEDGPQAGRPRALAAREAARRPPPSTA